MTYCEMITASKTWTCPKAGRWKIICVGGGASGGYYVGKTEGSVTAGGYQNAGGTTSFGSLLSATGGAKYATAAQSAFSALNFQNEVGGFGGYTGISYGGSPGSTLSSGNSVPSTGNGSLPGMSGIGWGAGGGTHGIGVGTTIPFSGMSGEFKAIEVDLALNQSIACTIGKGGAAVNTSTGNYNTYGTAGRDGVIVVRFVQ